MTRPTSYDQYLSERWQQAYGGYGASVARATPGIDRLSAHGAGHRARRCLAAGRRPARLRSRLHAQAASRPQRRRIGMLIPLRTAGTDERNMDFPRRSAPRSTTGRSSDWVGPEPRLRGSIYGAARTRLRLWRRSSAAPAIRASCRCCCRRARGAARQAPLLADVRGRTRRQPPDGDAHRRPGRASASPAPAGRPTTSRSTTPTFSRCCRW